MILPPLKILPRPILIAHVIRNVIQRALTTAFVALLLVNSVQAQISGTWTGAGGLDGNWSTASNWAGGITPTGSTVASATAVINFGATTGTTIVNQDLGFPFLLNRLTFTSDLPITGSSPALFTLTGGAL